MTITTLTGTDGNDRLSVNTGNASIIGLGGDDTLRSGDGNDVLSGGAGDDNLDGAAGDDTLDGGDGYDILDGGADGSDLLLGGSGHDEMGASGLSTQRGGAGDDWLNSTVSDTAGDHGVIDGGDGFDSVELGIPGLNALLQQEDGSFLLLSGESELNISAVESFNIHAAVEMSSRSPDSDWRIYSALQAAMVMQETPLTGEMHLNTPDLAVDSSGADLSINGMFDRFSLTSAGGGNDQFTWLSRSGDVRTSAGNDTVNAGSADDSVLGGADDDSLSGGQGNDVLHGDGDHRNDAEAALPADADTLLGGKGHDLLLGDNIRHLVGVVVTQGGNDVLRGGEGDDSLHGQIGSDLLVGGAGNDLLEGDGEYGNAADDALAAGNDTLQGDAGHDTLRGDAGDDALSGGEDADLLYGDGGDDTLDGDTGDDALSGGDGNDLLRGGRGHDTLQGGAGADTLTGGAGVDLFLADALDVITDFVEGEDILVLDGVLPTAVRDGTTSADALFAQPGHETTLNGQAGDDTLTGGSSNENLDGGDGNDLLQAGAGNDILSGGDGTDRLLGGAGNDMLHGSGNDTLNGGSGVDRYELAQGFTGVLNTREADGHDALQAERVSAFVEDYGIGIRGEGAMDLYLTAAAEHTGPISLVADERIVGLHVDGYGNSVTAITLVASGTTRSLSTGNGDDVVFMSAATESVSTGDGNDALFLAGNLAYPARAWLDGSSGDDRFILDTPQREDLLGVVLFGSDGTDAVHVELGMARFQSDGVENFYGYATDVVDIRLDGLHGSHSDDRLLLHSTVPTRDLAVFGDYGNDQLTGSSGNDWLYGGEGNDTLEGGTGQDLYLGYDYIDDSYHNPDTYLFNNALTGENLKTLYEFQSGEDVIAISRWATNLESTGVLDDTRLVSFSTELTAETRFTFNYDQQARQYVLAYDADGSGDAEAVIFARIHNGNVLTAADIHIVDIGWQDGGAGNDSLTGLVYNERLDARAGNDHIDAGDGNDTLYGRYGADTLRGGLGSDVMHGGGDHDLLLGEDGYDTLDGGDGRDTLDGGFGEDLLLGGARIDSLTGGFGDDTLAGGQGNDRLAGGQGADTFHFSTVANGLWNRDLIADFEHGKDVLALDANAFAALTPGALDAGAFVIGASAQDADDRIVYHAASGGLYYDADGSGASAQVLFAVLENHASLGAVDFVVS